MKYDGIKVKDLIVMAQETATRIILCGCLLQLFAWLLYKQVDTFPAIAWLVVFLFVGVLVLSVALMANMSLPWRLKYTYGRDDVPETVRDKYYWRGMAGFVIIMLAMAYYNIHSILSIIEMYYP